MDTTKKTTGRKALDLSCDDKKKYINNRKRKWEQENPEKMFSYRRNSVLRCCLKRSSLPTAATVKKYKFNHDELAPIFEKLKLIAEE